MVLVEESVGEDGVRGGVDDEEEDSEGRKDEEDTVFTELLRCKSCRTFMLSNFLYPTFFSPETVTVSFSTERLSRVEDLKQAASESLILRLGGLKVTVV